MNRTNFEAYGKRFFQYEITISRQSYRCKKNQEYLFNGNLMH